MKRMYMQSATLIGLFAMIVMLFTSACSTGRKLNYFNDLPDSASYQLKAMPVPERVIERGDRLDIAFLVKDQESAAFFNKHSMGGVAGAAAAVTGAAGAGTGGGTNPDYLVDVDGDVEMPVVGKVKLAGLTTSLAKEKLKNAVSPYLKEPLVEVRFSTFKVTIIGEVKNPGTFVMSAQHATLLEALAAAGDLPHSAKRYDVRLLRTQEGIRTVKKFDLRKGSVLDDPDLFQMRPNDVIYVQARSGSILKEEFGLVASVVSIIISAITLGFTIQNTNK